MNGKRRRRSRMNGLNIGGVQDTLVQGVLPAMVGFIAGRIVSKQLTALSSDKGGMIGNIIKLGGGTLLAASGSGFFQRMGIGLAAEGATAVVLPQLAKAGVVDATIGLLPPGRPSMYIAGAPGAGTEVMETPGPVKITML